MNILAVIPTQREFNCCRLGWAEHGCQCEEAVVGRLPVLRLPELGVTLAHGGLGKVQFAVQTQHLLDAHPHWDLVICAGAAGALVDELAIGDIVVATETVEHDIDNRFGNPLLPKFCGDPPMIAALRHISPALPSFQVHFGAVASGDEDVVDTERRLVLHTRTGALAVAWEGAGGARACQFSGVPFIEIRGISDQANQHAASHFEANVNRAMTNIATLITSWINGSLFVG